MEIDITSHHTDRLERKIMARSGAIVPKHLRDTVRCCHLPTNDDNYDGESDKAIWVSPSFADWPLVDDDWDDATRAKYNAPISRDALAGMHTPEQRREACHYSIRYLKESLELAAEIHSLLAKFEDLVKFELALLDHYQHKDTPPKCALTRVHNHAVFPDLHGRTRPLMVACNDPLALFKMSIVSFYWPKGLSGSVFRQFFVISVT